MELRETLMIASLGAVVGTYVAFGTEPCVDSIVENLSKSSNISELREAKSYAYQEGDLESATALQTYIDSVSSYEQ